MQIPTGPMMTALWPPSMNRSEHSSCQTGTVVADFRGVIPPVQRHDGIQTGGPGPPVGAAGFAAADLIGQHEFQELRMPHQGGPGQRQALREVSNGDGLSVQVGGTAFVVHSHHTARGIHCRHDPHGREARHGGLAVVLLSRVGRACRRRAVLNRLPVGGGEGARGREAEGSDASNRELGQVGT